MAYHKDLCSPAFVEIPGGLKNGHQITVWGKVTGNGFAINFQKDQSECTDIAFHFNPRENQQTVVRNTFLNGCWQHEERDDLCSFPFNVGQEFKVHVTVTSSGYLVYVNSQYFLTYAHRINHRDVCYLELTEGADYHEVEIKDRCRVPYNRSLPELSDGMCVSVKGLINTDASRFQINLTCDANKDKIALHCNPRQDQNDTVLNSFINGCWGEEERGFSYFPFTRGEFFDINILVHDGSFIITANGQHLANYSYRVCLSDVRFLNIEGDIALMDVIVNDQLLNDWVKPIAGGLQEDDMISVEGFFKPGVDRFQVNLLTGSDTSSERALHVNPRIGQNEVVLNNTVGGCWQTEVKYPLPADLQCSVPFCIDIINRACGFDVYINGKKLGNFPHREAVANIKSIYCTADAYFHFIRVFHKMPNPSAMPTGTPANGDWCSVVGIPTSDSVRFAIDLKTGSDTAETACNDVLFHYNPRFSEGVTVRNTLENGCWGGEEREESSFPFNPTDIFEVNMLLTSCDYKVVANRRHHINYAHRISPDRISHVITRLDADYYDKQCY